MSIVCDIVLGNCRSLSLDLVDQVENLDKTGQFRFTPPTHTLLAFKMAVEEFWREGGLQGRSERYKANRQILKEALDSMGFKQLVADEHAGYIITSYLCPKNFNFKRFYDLLSESGKRIFQNGRCHAAGRAVYFSKCENLLS